MIISCNVNLSIEIEDDLEKEKLRKELSQESCDIATKKIKIIIEELNHTYETLHFRLINKESIFVREEVL